MNTQSQNIFRQTLLVYTILTAASCSTLSSIPSIRTPILSTPAPTVINQTAQIAQATPTFTITVTAPITAAQSITASVPVTTTVTSDLERWQGLPSRAGDKTLPEDNKDSGRG